MKKIPLLLLFVFIFLALLVACAPNSQRAVGVVEEYLELFSSKDTTRLSAITCAEWTMEAGAEINSFQAVDVSIQNLECEETGVDGGYILVACQGRLITSYDGEQQEIDLSLRTYQVIDQGGNFLVCGYR